jgi:hypothetical protein
MNGRLSDTSKPYIMKRYTLDISCIYIYYILNFCLRQDETPPFSPDFGIDLLACAISLAFDGCFASPYRQHELRDKAFLTNFFFASSTTSELIGLVDII